MKLSKYSKTIIKKKQKNKPSILCLVNFLFDFCPITLVGFLFLGNFLDGHCQTVVAVSQLVGYT